MTTQVEELVVKLKADIADFEKGMKKGETQSRRTTRKMGDDFKHLQGLARRLKAGLVAAFTAVTLGGIRGTLDAMQEMSATMATLSLSAEELSGLKFAFAEIGNVNPGRADQMLRSLIKRIGEAKAGMIESRAQFKALGVDLNQDLIPIIYDTAQAMAELENDQERLAAATKIFETEGAIAAAIFKDGAAGLKEAEKFGKDLGVIYEDAQVEAAAKAGRTLDRWGEQLGAWWGKLVSGVVNEIDGTNKFVNDMMAAIDAQEQGLQVEQQTVATKKESLAIEGKKFELAKAAREITQEVAQEEADKKEEVDNLIKSLQVENSMILLTADAQEAVLIMLEAQNLAKARGRALTEQELKDLEEVIKQRGKLLKTLDKEEARKEKIADVSQDITDITFDNIRYANNLKDAFRQMAIELAEYMIKVLVLDQLKTTVSTSLQLALGGVPGFAGGGRTQAGRPVMVGERGPEIFVPDSSGKILNNAQSRDVGGGGMSFVQHNHFESGVTRQEVAALLPQIQRSAMAGVAEMASRPGSYSRMIRNK